MILITGGLGYIGSHTAVSVLQSDPNARVLIADNLCNSSEDVLDGLDAILGEAAQRLFYERVELCDATAVDALFKKYPVRCVIHCAGLKSVPQSVREPDMYYRTNIVSTLNVLRAMCAHGVRNIVFSSSATVYGNAARAPFTEEDPVGRDIGSPYGQTKYMIEQILADTQRAHPHMRVCVLRYFNPIGVHPSGALRAVDRELNNLFPYVVAVHEKRRDVLSVYGTDYDTRDGTCERDYIHVCDLADAHTAALQLFAGDAGNAGGVDNTTNAGGVWTYNVGTGRPVSVFEILREYELANNTHIPKQMCARRAGDAAVTFACVEKIQRELGWRAHRTLQEMVKVL